MSEGWNRSRGCHQRVSEGQRRALRKRRQNLEKIRDLKHEHLIEYIATFNRGELNYILFPWADGGNLRNLWADYDKARESKHKHEVYCWSFQQMLGLADALRLLHSKKIRHGDIKPQNILHFKRGIAAKDRGPDGVLVMADVGVSSYHDLVTGARKKPTDAKFTTDSYEAPEVDFDREKPRSRKYDTWSM